MEASLQLLFPTPVIVSDIPEIPQDDHDFLLNADYHVTEGSYGQFSKTKNTYILKNRDTTLTRWIQSQIDSFAYNILATRSKLKITQSWCLKHEHQPQKVFSHQHPNSIVSGAYYVSAPENSQNIRFHRNVQSGHPMVKWDMPQELLQDKMWAWEWQEIPVTTGRLVLFPSQMYHSVEGSIPNDNMRCVLSFNTWFDGDFGSEDHLYELKA